MRRAQVFQKHAGRVKASGAARSAGVDPPPAGSADGARDCEWTRCVVVSQAKRRRAASNMKPSSRARWSCHDLVSSHPGRCADAGAKINGEHIWLRLAKMSLLSYSLKLLNARRKKTSVFAKSSVRPVV